MKPRFQDGPSPLERALAAVDVPAAWLALGLQGTPGKSCRSPFREDRSPSFSVFDHGRKFKDHSTGEGGDVADFVALALNVDRSEACRWLIDFAQTGRPLPAYHRPPAYATAKPSPRPEEAPAKAKSALVLPDLDNGQFGDVRALATLRKLPFLAGIEDLISRGILRFANLPEGRAWVLVDGTRRNAQARLLSGNPLHVKGRGVKAKTLPGSEASWPVGLEDAKYRPFILLTEGGPDVLAAATALFWERTTETRLYGFAAMLGAGQSIHPDALPHFAGKRVRIFMHRDPAGNAAASAWFAQLTAAGATVDVWRSDLNGEDFNDYVSRTFSGPDEDWEGGFPEVLTPEPQPQKNPAA